MTLAALIRKRESGSPANANPAKAANDGLEEGEALAKLAPLALATPTHEETAEAVTSWGWLLHFADREPLEVYCNPDATHAEILERYPDVLAAEPIPKRTRRPPTEAEAAELRDLVRAVGERLGWTAREVDEGTTVALADVDGALTCWRLLAAESRFRKDDNVVTN